MATKAFTGGGKLENYLQELARKLNKNPAVNVGFFSGSMETKTDVPSAYVALLNEYGSNLTDAEGNVRKTPPRPFFRNMIQKGQPHWGEDLGNSLVRYQYNTDKAFKFMGEQMSEELQESMQAPGYAPLKESTVKRKGNSQTLIDSSDMLNAVQFQMKE